MRKVIAAILVSVFVYSATAQADEYQDYPKKPVTLIVPYSAGGVTDILARLMAEGMSERLAQPVIVENRPGAGGAVGATYAAHARGDGYTLLFGNLGPNAINPSIYPELQYDPVEDFQAISNVADTPFILVVPPEVKAQSLEQLIELGKAEPNKHFFASVGLGSASHVAGELFNVLTGTKFKHVPYKGSGPASLATMAGEVTMYLGTGPEITTHINNGRLRPLAISTRERSDFAPDIPTMAEAGVENFEVSVWFGLFAPASTPRSIIDKLNKVVVETVNSPEVSARIRQGNSVPAPSSPDEFQARVEAEVERWAQVVAQSGATAE